MAFRGAASTPAGFSFASNKLVEQLATLQGRRSRTSARGIRAAALLAVMCAAGWFVVLEISCATSPAPGPHAPGRTKVREDPRCALDAAQPNDGSRASVTTTPERDAAGLVREPGRHVDCRIISAYQDHHLPRLHLECPTPVAAGQVGEIVRCDGRPLPGGKIEVIRVDGRYAVTSTSVAAIVCARIARIYLTR